MKRDAERFRIADLARRLANVVRPGVVAEVDSGAAAVRVRYAEAADAVTAWLPFLAARAGGDVSWWPPEIGEQVVVLAPSGELSQGVVLGALYSDAHPAPAAADRHRVEYADGAVIEYDREAHRLRAELPAGGAAEISAPDGVAVTGDLRIDGDVRILGEVEATGDIHTDGNLDSDGKVEDLNGSMQEMRTVYNAHTHGVPPGIVTPPPNQRMT